MRHGTNAINPVDRVFISQVQARMRMEPIPATMMTRVLGVSWAGFCECLEREPSERTLGREQAGRAPEEKFYRYKSRYGAPRLQRELCA